MTDMRWIMRVFHIFPTSIDRGRFSNQSRFWAFCAGSGLFFAVGPVLGEKSRELFAASFLPQRKEAAVCIFLKLKGLHNGVDNSVENV